MVPKKTRASLRRGVNEEMKQMGKRRVWPAGRKTLEHPAYCNLYLVEVAGFEGPPPVEDV